MPGEIISEHRARSNRNGGRHHRGFAGDFPRNPHRAGTVEIDRLTPVVVVAISEISRGEQFEIISVRAEMIIDDVKDDCDPKGVSAVNEAAEISRQTIEAGWCKEIDAVICPAE